MARIEKYNGYPALMVDGVPYPPMMATIRTNNVDSLVIDKEYYKNLGKSGVKIFFLICDRIQFFPEVQEGRKLCPDFVNPVEVQVCQK